MHTPTPFFRTGSRGLRVHVVVWGGIAGGVVLAAWGVHLGLTLGLAPQDGGVLRPMSERLLWAGLLVGLGLLSALGLLLYSQLYVTHASLDARFGKVEVKTLAPWAPPLQVALRFVEKPEHRRGRSKATDAPWIRMPVEGRRFPFIFDARGEFLDADTARRVLGEALTNASDWEARR
jgi:hypothetical protein